MFFNGKSLFATGAFSGGAAGAQWVDVSEACAAWIAEHGSAATVRDYFLTLTAAGAYKVGNDWLCVVHNSGGTSTQHEICQYGDENRHEWAYIGNVLVSESHVATDGADAELLKFMVGGKEIPATAKDGKDGKDGHTPVKGVDYYTDEEKAEFVAYLATELAKRGQLKPEFANSVDECTDTSKLYVLPDGFIYAYTLREVKVGGYTNRVDISSDDFYQNSRINASCAVASASVAGAFVSNIFDCKAGDILRIKGITGTDSTSATAPAFVVARLKADGTNLTNANNMAYLKQHLGVDQTAPQKCWDAVTTDENGVMTWTYAMNNSGTNFATANGEGAVKARIAGIATNGIENVVVTVNEEIVEPTVVKQYAWGSTGHAFVPADYEGQIVALAAETAELRAAVAEVNKKIDSGAAAAKSGARWYAMGDSITQGWASEVDETADAGYRQFLNTNDSERWVNIVAELNGYELTNLGIGGTGYAWDKNGTLQNARTLADNTDFSQCDFVTLAYGVNDWKYAAPIGSMSDDIASGGTMVSNMRYVIKKILADNPKCKIFVITPINCKSLGTYDTNWGIGYSGTATNGIGLEQIFVLQQDVCSYHGIELIDMTHDSVVNRENIRTLLADSVHPTVDGHRIIARELARKICFE